MTMVPAAQTLSKQQQLLQQLVGYAGYGGGGCGVMSRLDGYEYCVSEQALLGSDLLVPINPMAEDESRTSSLNEEAATSSSKDDHHHRPHRSSDDNNNNSNNENHQGWLQLSIGGNNSTTETSCSNIIKHEEEQLHGEMDPTARRGGNLIELDLLPGSSTSSSQQQGTRPLTNIFHVPEFRAPPPRPLANIGAAGTANLLSTTSLFFPQQQQQGSSSTSTYVPQYHQYPYHQDISWAFRHMAPLNIASSSSSLSPSSSSPSTSSSLMPLGPYFSRPYHHHQLHHTTSTGIDVAGPSSDFRVIDRPRRPHSGIWFMLQASLNQAKEPFLPQISKSYLRIKDGRMTVRLLMKYLVNKLRLDSESEIEITCRGQQLRPSLTLQHVRDNIWSPRDAVTLLPDSSSPDHVMVLHYGRSA